MNKVLTINAFSFGSEKPIAKKMAVVKDPNGITLRSLIDEKVKQAKPSFLFSAVDHITQVVTTNDQTDAVDLLDFPVSLLLEQLESRPEISVTIDNTAVPLSSDNGIESTKGGNGKANNDNGNVESKLEPIVGSSASNDDDDDNESQGDLSILPNAKNIASNQDDGVEYEGGDAFSNKNENSGGSREANNEVGNEEAITRSLSSSSRSCPRFPLDDESMDALAKIVREELAKRELNPQEPIKFDPSSKTPLLPVTVGGTNVMDTVSVMTPISVSIREPEVPVRDYERYQESTDLATLQDLVNDFTEAGNDEGVIEMVTEKLIEDNGLSISFDVPLFCLTTLWVVARKSDENKRKIIFDGATLETIIEVMLIYRGMSAEIQTRACGLLWALSMEAKDRVHIAQSGACDAILNGMAVHIDEGALQVMGLGCLKALSSSSHSKSNMSLKTTPSVVADVMEKHVYKPVVQSEGCHILGNLAVSDVDQFVHTVTEREISAVVNGMLANPEEVEVHEAACFTLMRLASSAANVDLIRGNNLSRVSLEQAFKANPDKVGNNILILLRRLKFDAPAVQERSILSRAQRNRSGGRQAAAGRRSRSRSRTPPGEDFTMPVRVERPPSPPRPPPSRSARD